MGKEKRPPRESHQKTPVEQEVDKTKKTGRPSKPGTPDQEQMDRERQDAVKAAANITRGVNGKSKAVKREDERSPRGTPSSGITKVEWGQYILRRLYLGILDVSLDPGGKW